MGGAPGLVTWQPQFASFAFLCALDVLGRGESEVQCCIIFSISDKHPVCPTGRAGSEEASKGSKWKSKYPLVPAEFPCAARWGGKEIKECAWKWHKWTVPVLTTSGEMHERA